MKKLFQLSLICFVLLATACKKEASPTTAVPTVSITQPQPEAESTGSAANGEWAQPNGAVKLTDELNAALEAGEPLFVKQVADHHYIGDVIATPQNATSDIPCNRVIDRLNIYMNANLASFLAWANANCQPYIANYHDACGKTILFMVRPTNPNCGPLSQLNPNCWTLANGWWQSQFDITKCIFD